MNFQPERTTSAGDLFAPRLARYMENVDQLTRKELIHRIKILQEDVWEKELVLAEIVAAAAKMDIFALDTAIFQAEAELDFTAERPTQTEVREAVRRRCKDLEQPDFLNDENLERPREI